MTWLALHSLQVILRLCTVIQNQSSCCKQASLGSNIHELRTSVGAVRYLWAAAGGAAPAGSGGLGQLSSASELRAVAPLSGNCQLLREHHEVHGARHSSDSHHSRQGPPTLIAPARKCPFEQHHLLEVLVLAAQRNSSHKAKGSHCWRCSLWAAFNCF